jgi:hypothetical protein
MKQEVRLGLIAIIVFTASSLFVMAADKPRTTSKPASAAAGQNRADAIEKSCQEWQKRRTDACKKAAPKKKQERDENFKKDPQFYRKQACEGVTQGKEEKLCDDEGRFVLNDSNYGTQYQFTCSYEGKLFHWDNLSPAFRVDATTGSTDKLIGKGYCVANRRIENVMEDREKCTVFPYDTAGTFPKVKFTDKKKGDKNTCREGIVQMAGDFDDAVVKKLNKDIPCFQAAKVKGKKAAKGEVGVISGFHGGGEDGKTERRIITFCRDHQKEVNDILKKKAEDGALAYDQEKKQFKLSEAGDDKKKQEEAKESLKKSPIAPTKSALDLDTSEKPFKPTGSSTKPTGVTEGKPKEGKIGTSDDWDTWLKGRSSLAEKEKDAPEARALEIERETHKGLPSADRERLYTAATASRSADRAADRCSGSCDQVFRTQAERNYAYNILAGTHAHWLSVIRNYDDGPYKTRYLELSARK